MDTHALSPQRAISFSLTVAMLLCPISSAWGGVGVMARFNDPRPIIIGHRGCWQSTSENSVSGLDACAAHGIDMVEIDIRQTKDGAPVLMHDDTIDRTTDRSGRVEDLTLTEFKSAHLRRGAGGKDAAITNETPPTFAEMLHAAKGKASLFLDIRVDYALVARAVEGEGAQDWVVFPAEFNSYSKLPDWAQRRAMLLVFECGGEGECSPILKQAVERFRPLHPLSVAIVFKNDAYVTNAASELAASGSRLCAWSVSEPEWDGGRKEASQSPGAKAVWGQLLKLGFNVIETNDALSLGKFLRLRKVGASQRSRPWWCADCL